MSNISHRLDNCKMVNIIGLYLLPIISFAAFLLSCVLSLGNDEKVLTFGNFCTMMCVAYSVGIIFSLIAYFIAKSKCANTPTSNLGELMWKDYKLELKINVFTSLAILIGMTITFWVLWILNLPIFSKEVGLNLIRLVGTFGFPCLIAMGVTYVSGEINEKLSNSHSER